MTANLSGSSETRAGIRCLRRPLALSFGFSAALILFLIGAVFISSEDAHATTYAITSTGGPIKDWNTPTTWTPNGVPGSAPGDVVNITTVNAQVQLTTGLANPLAGFAISGSNILVEVTGGSLDLAGASTVGFGAKLKLTSAGTVASNGTLDIGGQLQSLGGTIRGTTVTISPGGVLTVENPTTLDNGVNVVVNGGTLLTNNAVLSVNNSSFISLNSGTFDLQTDFGVNSDLSPLTRIDLIGGLLTKNGGAGTATLTLPVNTGPGASVSAASGTLQLDRGGAHSGSFATTTVADALVFSGGTHQFTGTPSFAGPGKVILSGGVADFDTNVTIPVTMAMTQSGGIMTGTGDVNITGPFTWAGGTMDNSSGGGRTIINNSVNITTTAGPVTLSGRDLDTHGLVTYQPTGANYLSINSGGELYSYATFNFTGDFPILSDGTSNPEFQSGGGSVTKTGGLGTADIHPLFMSMSASTITISSGSIAMHAGGEVNGNVFLANATNQLILLGGTFQVNAPTAFLGLGVMRVDGAGATLTLNTPLTIDNLDLAQGTVNGSNLNIGKKLNWTGGGFSGAGQTTIAATAVVDHLAPTALTRIDGRIFINNGQFNYNPGGFGLGLQNSGSLTNAMFATFSIQGNGPITSSGTTTFTNDGTITKTGGAGSTDIQPVLINYNIVNSNVAGGTINLAGGGTMSSGSLNIAANATIAVPASPGNFGFSGGVITGPGTFAVTGGTVFVSVNLSAPNVLIQASTSILFVNPGFTLNVDNLTWKGGRITGPGTTRLLVAGNIDNTAATILESGHVLQVDGLLDYDADNTSFTSVNSAASMLITATGMLRLRADGTIGGGPTVGISVQGGILRKTVGTGVSRVFPRVTSTAGAQIGATTGTLLLQPAAPSTFTNTTLDTGSGTSKIELQGSTQAINAGSTVTGTGTLQLTTGTLDVLANITISNFVFVNGIVQGTGTIGINNGTWSSGSINAGGTITVNGGAQFDLLTTGSRTLSRSLVNDGTVRIVAGGLIGGVGGALTNNSLFDIATDATLNTLAPPAVFTNAATGTLRKSAGTLFSQILWQMDNAGLVESNSGEITIRGGGTHTGPFTIAAGASMQFGVAPNTWAVSSTISGGGHLILSSNQTYAGGPITMSTPGGRITFGSGTTALNSPATTPQVSFSSGTHSGSGTLTIVSGGSTPSDFSAGTVSLATINLNSGAQLDLTGSSGAMTLSGSTLNANGTLNLTSPTNDVTISGGTSIVVGASGIFDLKTDRSFPAGAGGGSISSSGIFRKSAAAGTSTVGASFTSNGGQVQLQSGTVAFNGGFTQSSGTTTLAGGGMSSTSTVSIAGGFLDGAGTVGAALSNGGTIRPGAGLVTGTIALTGGFTQTAGGKLEIDIGGPAAGSQYDVLTSTGQPTLAGTFQGTLINAFIPLNGQTFDPITYATAPATNWTTTSLPPFGVGGSFSTSFQPTAFRLAAVIPNADLAVTQITSTPPAFVGNTIAYIITVTNNGPDQANAVTLNNVLSGPATLQSAVPTAGSCVAANCTLGNLLPGQTVTVVLQLTATGLGTVNNTATATTTVTDPNPANNSSGPVPLVISPLANVAVAVSDAPDPVNAVTNVTYTVTLNNAGPDPAQNPSVLLTLLGGNFVSITSGFTCSGGASPRTCTAATLGTGATTLTVVAQASTLGVMSLAASYSSPTFDTNPADNFALQSTTITPVADLVVNKSGPATAIAGNSITYTVSIQNLGPSDAFNVNVADTTPAGTTFVSSTGACVTPYPCTIVSIPAGQTLTITSTYIISSTATGPVTNTATATFPFSDPNTTNNSATTSTTVTQSADVSITKSGAATVIPGGQIVYTIAFTNNGPSTAATVVVSDPTPAGTTFVSNSGACSTPFPCTFPTIAPGITATINATYRLPATATGSIVNTASLTATTPDPLTANNSSSVTAAATPTADMRVKKSGPVTAPRGSEIVYTIEITNNGPSNVANVTVTDPTPPGLTFLSNSGACTNPFPCAAGAMTIGQQKVITSRYRFDSEVPVTNTVTVSSPAFDPVSLNNRSSVVTAPPAIDCSKPLNLVRPLSGLVASPLVFEWTSIAEATEYKVFAAMGSGPSTEVGRTVTTQLSATLPINGPVSWFVEATVPGCGAIRSATATFNVCNPVGQPLARVVGEVTTGIRYGVEWDAVENAVRYEIDEANNASFIGAARSSTTGTSLVFQHTAPASPHALYYRVRAFSECSATPGNDSPVIRVVIVPLPSPTDPNPNINVPVGSDQSITQQIFIPGQPGATLFFTARVDQPWISVSPISGTIPPQGVTLQVTTDPRNLPNGTFTASVIVTISSGPISVSADTSKTIPVSVSLVTPVSPVAVKPAPSSDSLIIPTVGHLAASDSSWQSDIRVTNVSTTAARYDLTFTPSAGSAASIRKTTISVSGGETTALDDVARNWYGIGSLGDSGSGMLEIRPADGQPLKAVASSRTYNLAANGTYGQFIPALPFSGFIGKSGPGGASAALSLQQIAQSTAYRTNVGVLEASGKPAEVLLSAFNAAGTRLTEVPVTLAANQQIQINSILKEKSITLDDGRIEVRVVNGEGRITAYASVVDNISNDPLLVNGVPLGAAGSTKYVVPGVADLSNDLAKWRTDMRLFNGNAAAQNATLTLHPLNAGTPLSAQVTIQPGEVLALNDVVKSLFAAQNIGGAVHVTTPGASSLIVTGRTYNQTSNGTLGQFIPAVTATDAVGTGDPSLSILQLEESPRYRSNLGLAEVTGKPVTVDVQVLLPNARFSPVIRVPLAANEFRQFSAIHDLALGNVYNARISVKAVSGEGKVTAYGSVIDMTTQDPTYVPAQK